MPKLVEGVWGGGNESSWGNTVRGLVISQASGSGAPSQNAGSTQKNITHLVQLDNELVSVDVRLPEATRLFRKVSVGVSYPANLATSSEMKIEIWKERNPRKCFLLPCDICNVFLQRRAFHPV